MWKHDFRINTYGSDLFAWHKSREEGDLFNHTVIVKTRGNIDEQTCIAVVEDIWVENDSEACSQPLLKEKSSRGK